MYIAYLLLALVDSLKQQAVGNNKHVKRTDDEITHR